MHHAHPLPVVLAAALALAGGWCLYRAARTTAPAPARRDRKRRRLPAVVTAALIPALALTMSPLAAPTASAATCPGNTTVTGGITVKLPGYCPPAQPGQSINLKPPPPLKPLGPGKLNLHYTTQPPLTPKAGTSEQVRKSPDPCLGNPAGCYKPDKPKTVTPRTSANPCTSCTKPSKPHITSPRPSTNSCSGKSASCSKPKTLTTPNPCVLKSKTPRCAQPVTTRAGQGEKEKEKQQGEEQGASGEADYPFDSCPSTKQQVRKVVEMLLNSLLLAQSLASMNNDLLFPNKYLQQPLTDSVTQAIIYLMRDPKRLSMELREGQYPYFGGVGNTPDDLIKQLRKQAECVPELPDRRQTSHNVNSTLRNWPYGNRTR